MEVYDLLVIGAGSAGVRLSRMAAATGLTVAVVEKEYLGGTCVNVGCVPKKLFVYGSHVREDIEDAAGYGWQADSVKFDWTVLRRNKDNEINRLNGVYRNLLVNSGVTLIEGEASFVSSSETEVLVKIKSAKSPDSHLEGGEGTQIRAKKVIIATGSTPFIPRIPGSELANTSTDMFYLDKLPETAIVWGGGYIAVEFAGILQGLGVDTTLVYRGELFLRGFDEEVRQFVKGEIEKKGVKLRFNENIESLERGSGSEVLNVQLSSGERVCAGMVLAATGRVPNVKQLDLSCVSVQLNDKGEVKVDQNFRTSHPLIYGLGDVIGGPQLTPVALAEAMALLPHLTGGSEVKVDYDFIPTAVFCQPNIGTVGYSEEQARERYGDIAVFKSSFRPMKHTMTESAERTFMKLLVDRASDRVVGVHMVGAEAGEIIQGIAVAIKAGATKAHFDSTIGIHPTAAEEFVTMRQPSN